MALTPETFDVEESQDVIVVDEQSSPSKTWRIDFEGNRIRGMADGEQALRQFIRKAIETTRNRFIIYDDQYGCELDDLIGQNVSTELIETEIPRLIREALIYDDRVSDVTNIEITRTGSDLNITFTVELVSGDYITEGVTVNG